MMHLRHVIRIFIIFALLVAAGLIVRASMLPESFGKYGAYRGDNLQEQMEARPLYRGDDYCSECHEKESDIISESRHETVPCEDCHFIAGLHADGKKKLSNMPVDKSREGCTICHRHLASRPKDFPQVKDFDAHIKDNWKSRLGEIDLTAGCWNCHKAHKPEILERKEAVF